jgi:ABC-type bacteriocin/lantibiotic exporter with double-glycine peptidase domain
MPADTVAENLVRFVGAVFLISHYNLKLTLIAMIVLALFFEVARWYVARSERRV